MSAIKALKDEDIQNSIAAGHFEILGERIELDEIRVIYCTSNQIGSNFEAHSDNEILVLMDMTPNPELLEEGLAREVINRVQKLKKKGQLVPTDPVLIFYALNKETTSDGVQIEKVLKTYNNMIKTTIKSEFLKYSKEIAGKKRIIIKETFDLKGISLELTICSTEEHEMPSAPWLNIMLADDVKQHFGKSRHASILMENPITKQNIKLNELHNEIEILFGLHGINVALYVLESQNNIKELKNIDGFLNGKLVIVSRKTQLPISFVLNEDLSTPFCKFINKNSGTLFIENPRGVKLV